MKRYVLPFLSRPFQDRTEFYWSTTGRSSYPAGFSIPKLGIVVMIGHLPFVINHWEVFWQINFPCYASASIPSTWVTEIYLTFYLTLHVGTLNWSDGRGSTGEYNHAGFGCLILMVWIYSRPSDVAPEVVILYEQKIRYHAWFQGSTRWSRCPTLYDLSSMLRDRFGESRLLRVLKSSNTAKHCFRTF